MALNQLQIAEKLQINRVYVARLIREGKIKGQKVGRSYKVSRENLDKYLGVKSDQKFYTLQEVADLLKLHRTFVSKLIHEGNLKTVQIGRFYRIPECELTSLFGELPNKIYTIAELSEITNIARSNIVRAIQTNRLKAVKLGTEYRITKESAEEYLHIPLVQCGDMKKKVEKNNFRNKK